MNTDRNVDVQSRCDDALYRHLLIVIVAVCIMLFATEVRADPQGINDFVARKSGWEGLVDRTLDLEGRGGSLIGTSLKMKGCDLTFVLPEGATKPDTYPNLRLTGKLVKVGRNLEFHVTQILPWKSDLAMVDDKLRVGDATKLATYESTADWAQRRGEFYSDNLLTEEATRVREKGIRRALQGTPVENTREIMALSEKVTLYRLAASVQEECLFAATWGERSIILREDHPKFAALLGAVESRFPSARKPLEELTEQETKRFSEISPAKYRDATPLERTSLHRLLYLDVARRLIESEAAKDGSDGFKVATRIDSLAPELATLAESYRQKELDFLMGRVEKMSREELMGFSRRLVELKESERDKKAREQWMAQRQRMLATQRIDKIDLADDTLVVLGDQSKAIELLGEVLLRDPKNAAALERIKKLGFAWYEGRAIPLEDAPEPMVDPLLAEIEAGRVAVGMTASQVRQSYGGLPERIVRMVNRKGTGELWDYSEIGTSVYLEARESDRQLVVSRVMSYKKRASPVAPTPPPTRVDGE